LLRTQAAGPRLVGARPPRVARARAVCCGQRAEPVGQARGARAAALGDGGVGVAGYVFGGGAVGVVADVCAEGEWGEEEEEEARVHGWEEAVCVVFFWEGFGDGREVAFGDVVLFDGGLRVCGTAAWVGAKIG
jgi:hypothetical protein